MEVELNNISAKRTGVYKYKTEEEERVKRYKEQKNSYSRKPWLCECCDCEYTLGNKWAHLKSNKHLHYATLYASSTDKDIVKSKYENEYWFCELCNYQYTLKNKQRHLNSKNHTYYVLMTLHPELSIKK